MKNKKEYLEYKIKQIPELPGVYKMLDRKGNIIYIGKETLDYWDFIYSEIQNAPTDFIYIMK